LKIIEDYRRKGKKLLKTTSNCREIATKKIREKLKIIFGKNESVSHFTKGLRCHNMRSRSKKIERKKCMY